MIARLAERLVAACARRPARTLALVGLLAAAGAAAALTLPVRAATDTLAGRGSAVFAATERHRAAFGDEAVVVLVRGELPRIVLTENLGRLLALEGCLAGNPPAGATLAGGRRGPCAALAHTKPVRAVYGPGTFVNTAVGEIQDRFRARVQARESEARQAATAARRSARRQGASRALQRRRGEQAAARVYAQAAQELLLLNLRYDLGARLPQLDDTDFVSKLVFDAARGSAAMPKARFAHLFPNEKSAVVQVRLEPDLKPAERTRAIEHIRAAVALPAFALRDASYTITGVPVVAEELASSLAGALAELLALALAVMAVVLALALRSRARLVPLGVALAAAVVAFGALAVAGGTLTLASIAVLPVLIGLATDSAIQYQARVEEAEREGRVPAAAARHAARVAVPSLAVAGVATLVGFLVLALSPVPLVRSFGILLVAGVLVAFVLALVAGTAALVATGRGGGGRLGRSVRGAGLVLDGARAAAFARPARALKRIGRATLSLAIARPLAVVVAAAALAAGGWALESRLAVVSDLRALVPASLPALRDLETLQSTTGVAGEVDVLVEGDDVTRPAVVEWMRDLQAELLASAGFDRSAGCGQAELCPALSLPDLLRSEAATADRARVRALLDAVPAAFSQAVISPDRRTATLAFGIKLMPLSEQHAVIARMRSQLDPPPGVRAEVAGVTALAAGANAALADPLRRALTVVAGLAAVALVLLAAYRRPRRVLAAMAPVVLATGWSALILWLLGVPLNPLSASLGALVIAISTQFSVLLSARFEAERRVDGDVAAALRRTYASTGTAVLASGATAIAGFGVLSFSEVRMLQDFGLVSVIDLVVSLLGVLVVGPAVLVLAARRGGRRAGGPPPRAARPDERAAVAA
jgi:hydrophobe/amphiphile efflux-3 (HAE3) family protein